MSLFFIISQDEQWEKISFHLGFSTRSETKIGRGQSKWSRAASLKQHLKKDLMWTFLESLGRFKAVFSRDLENCLVDHRWKVDTCFYELTKKKLRKDSKRSSRKETDFARTRQHFARSGKTTLRRASGFNRVQVQTT